MKKDVGFDRKIMLRHLDYTAEELKRTRPKEMYEKLDSFLTADIQGTKSRRNSVTILMKIWGLVEEDHRDLQQKGLEMIQSIWPEERLALHYGMTILAYPLFRDLVNEMGSGFRLQDGIASHQIRRKIKALYGDRRHVEVATEAVLTSLRSWGVIETNTKWINTISRKHEVRSLELKRWLVNVLLHASEQDFMPLDILNNHPIFFPFDYSIAVSDLGGEEFQVIRQGLDMVMVGRR